MQKLRDRNTRVEPFQGNSDTNARLVQGIFLRNHPMRNFHLTHIAVNLSLIVALAIQPVAVCLASVDGASGCSNAPLSEPACGCCDPDETNDCDCCCSHAVESKRSTTPPSGSCGHADANLAAPTPNAGLAVAVDARFRSVCLCEQEAPPLSDSSPRRRGSETRDTFVLVSTVAEPGPSDHAQRDAFTMRGTGPSLPVHFTQIMLCIWRL